MRVYSDKIDRAFELGYLNEEDLKELYCSSYYINDFVKMKNNIFHMKIFSLNEVVCEVIGELISDYFKLDTVHSLMYKDEGNYFVLLTKIFTNSNSKYGFIDELFYENIYEAKDLCTLDEIKEVIDPITYDIYKIKKGCLERLILGLKKIIIRDFITNQRDRHPENFMFCYDKDCIELMPLYDYEHSFVKDDDEINNLLSLNLNKKNVVEYVRKDATFQELFERALLLNMKEIFKRLKEEYFIELNSVERWDYEEIVRKKQNEIKEYKLVR